MYRKIDLEAFLCELIVNEDEKKRMDENKAHN